MIENSKQAGPQMDSSSIVKNPIEADLISKVEPVLASMGYALRDLEVLGASGRSATVRVTLDSVTMGVELGIEDCSKVHQILDPLFDVWDPLPGAYTLEVSSPGEKPNLRLLKHFQEALGQKIHFQTLEPIPMPQPMKARRNWEGILKVLDATTGELALEDGYGEHHLKISQIRSATWLREWTLNRKEKI